MKTRILSAVVLLPILIFILIKGGTYLAIFSLFCALIGVHEFVEALGENSSKSTKYMLFLFSIIQIFLVYTNKIQLTLPVIFSLLLVQGALVVFEKIKPFDAGMSIFVFVYVSVSMSIIYFISNNALVFFPYIFIISMVTDTFAYFSGVFFGKHKLSPILSPKKTIEGSIGGILFCIIASFAYAYYFQNEFLQYCIPFALVGSIVSQIGDVFASAFKRAMGIKDYGNLIPGHGGIIDRADSIIFTTLYIYIVIVVMSI